MGFNLTQNLYVRKTLSFLLLIGQLFSLPLMSAQRLDAKARKIQRDKDLLVMQKIASEYNKSATIFNQKGSQAFVDSLPDSIFINEQRKFFIKELKGTFELPLLEVTDSHLLVKDSDTTFKMPIDQVLDGIFVFEDGALLYDFNRDVVHNIESWKDQTKKAGKSAYLNWLQFLFIPQAEAKFKFGMGTVIGFLLGGFLGAWIGHYFDKKKQEAAEASAAAAHATGPAGQRVGTVPGNLTPPPVVSETPAPAAKGKDDKTESSSESSQSESGSKKTEEPKADAFTDEKIYAQVLKKYQVDEEQIGTWRTTKKAERLTDYPAFAKKILEYLYGKRKGIYRWWCRKMDKTTHFQQPKSDWHS